jgi:soluble lytic murein transglycosylase
VLLALAGVRAVLRSAYPDDFYPLVERYSAQNGLPIPLVLGVIHTESRFRPGVVSSAGARGLMQITEETFEWAKWRMQDDQTEYDDLYDPESNIRYGTFILSLLLDEFGGPDEALAAYHAGWGSVKRWLAQPEYSADGATLDAIPFADTAQYVPRVLKTTRIYQRLYRYH